jgi:undecaprenyl-diphosphatase
LDTLLSWDIKILETINLKMTNPILDIIFPFIGSEFVIFVPIVILAFVLVLIGQNKLRRFCVLFILSFLCAYGISIFLKYIVHRPRPMNMTHIRRLLIGIEPENFSFPSTHSAIVFAAAYLFWVKYKSLAPYVYFIAVLVAWARIYVGVHYPSDVLFGALLGILISKCLIFIESRYFSMGNTENGKNERRPRSLC